MLNDLPAKTREILYLTGDKLKTRMNDLKKAREEYTQATQAENSKVVFN